MPPAAFFYAGMPQEELQVFAHTVRVNAFWIENFLRYS